jgi:hypothetical protein
MLNKIIQYFNKRNQHRLDRIEAAMHNLNANNIRYKITNIEFEYNDDIFRKFELKITARVSYNNTYIEYIIEDDVYDNVPMYHILSTYSLYKNVIHEAVILHYHTRICNTIVNENLSLLKESKLLSKTYTYDN